MAKAKGSARRRRALLAVLLLLAALFLGWRLYVGDYYRAGAEAQAVLRVTEPVSAAYRADLDALVFAPESAERGLIFYPGAKVEYTAYAPLMERFAAEGTLCVLLHMTDNLAVLEADAAAAIPAAFPEIRSWAVGGHSLGGVMAARFAAGHAGELEGLLLLAAYATEDLSASGLRVVSIFGSEDGVLDRGAYEKNRPLLPADTAELVLAGGCHAGFADYGAQKGDGTPTLSAEEQMDLTAAFAREKLWPDE